MIDDNEAIKMVYSLANRSAVTDYETEAVNIFHDWFDEGYFEDESINDGLLNNPLCDMILLGRHIKRGGEDGE